MARDENHVPVWLTNHTQFHRCQVKGCHFAATQEIRTPEEPARCFGICDKHYPEVIARGIRWTQYDRKKIGGRDFTTQAVPGPSGSQLFRARSFVEPPKPPRGANRDKVHALRQQGMSTYMIAEKLGLSRSRVSQILKMPPRPEFADAALERMATRTPRALAPKTVANIRFLFRHAVVPRDVLEDFNAVYPEE